MQLDKTRIAVRERSHVEIFDLALKVMRSHGLGLLVAMTAGALPFAVFNHWMLRGELDLADLDYEPPVFYLAGTLLLAAWQIPLAAVPVTLFLGQALFQETVDTRRLLRDLMASLPQLIYYQVFVRGWLMLLFLVGVVLDFNDEFNGLLLAAFGFYCFVLQVYWPHLNEVILLERNPWRRVPGSMGDRAATTAGRCKAIAGASGGDQFGRWLTASGIGVLLITMIASSTYYLYWRLTLAAFDPRPIYAVHLMLAVWVVISYLTVVRFLSYLDLRIRTEGWEIELRMRAEAARLARYPT